MCGCSSEVDVVVTGTGTYDDFQVFGGIQYFCVDDVAAYDETLYIFYSVDQFGFFTIFFKKRQFHTGVFYLFSDTFYGNGCKRFICCY